MCNYYSRHRPASELQATFGFVDPIPNLEPRYVVRPTDTERVVAIGKDGARHFPAMRWGLVPAWAEDIKTGLTLFNVRAETLRNKRAFAAPFDKRRRCVVPVDGFFEFTGERGAKQPWYFKPRDGRLMAFAGIWESWTGPRDAPLAEPLISFSVATTAPNATVVPIHARMPVLLTEDADWDAWLDPASAPDRLVKMLAPADDDLLEVFPVTRDLLKIKMPDASVLEPVSVAAT